MITHSQPARIGVIGLGQWGPNHVRNLKSIAGCDVVRVCDVDERRLEISRQQFREIETTTATQAITQAKDIDAVVIATPVHTHSALVKEALLAGKDVLCEKPLTQDAAESFRLAELAREQKRILMVGHVFLYNPGVLHLKADIDAGTFGQIYYLDAIRTNLGPVRSDVGAIQDLASHDISIFNFLLGSVPTEVSATGGTFLRESIEDIGFLTLNYPGGVVCHVHTSWLNPRKVRQLTIVGSSKMAVWDDMNNLEPIRHYDKGIVTDHYATFGEFQMILRDGTITIPKIKLAEPLLRQNQEFVRCIHERRQPLADGTFATAVVRVLDAARESLAERGRMTPVASA